MLLKTVIVLLSFVGFNLVAAGNDGNCQIEGLEDWPAAVYYLPNQNNDVLYDNDVNTTLFEGGYQGVLEITNCSCAECGSNYILFDKNETYFFIKTTEELLKYDEDVIKNPPKQLGMFDYLCTFKCNGDEPSDLYIRITLKDNNDFPPDFSTGKREYTVPFPIMPKFDFSVFGELIQASDKDFGNKYINFSTTPDDFDVIVTNDNSVPTLFTAHFQAKNVIMYEDNPITYNITATDSGDHPGPLSSTIKITLSKDNEYSVDTPSFDKQSYSFQYEKNNTLTPLDGAITVSTEKSSKINVLDLVGTLSDSFKCELTSTLEISCYVIKNVEDPSVDFVILTLRVKTDTVASTSLIIYFSSGSSLLKPSFSEHLYTGTYVDTSNTVKLDTTIEVSNPSENPLNVTIIGGDLYDQFSIQPSADKKSYGIKVETPLTVDDIKQHDFISLTLEVTNDKGSDNAIVNINLPVYDLAFTSVLYTGNYNDDDTVVLDENNPIAFKTSRGNVIITVDDDYSDFFKVTENYLIEVLKSLPVSIKTSNTEIAMTLTATDDYKNTQQAVLKLTLPLSNNLTAPEFQNLFYKVIYKQGATGSIDFEENIEFKNVEDLSKVTIDLSAYTENFDVKYIENKWQFQIIKPLDDSIFDTTTDLVTIMEANLTGSDQVGSGVLVIELISDKVVNKEPKFEKAYYSATYPESGKGTIEFDSDINFENVDDMSKVNITDVEYSTNFEVSYNENSKKWEIIIKTPLEDTLLESKYLASTLSATIEDSDEKSLAAFILNLPETKELIFNRSYYKATYVINENNATIVFDDYIGFTNKDDMNDIIIVADEYPKNFNFKYDGKNWQAASTDILNVNQLNRTDLVVTITAEDKSNKLLGHSVIDLKLPSINTDGAPKFSKTYYIAHYQISGEKSTVTLDDDFSFSNKDDMSKIKIRTDKYNDYFNITHTGTNWVINVVKNLESSILSAKVDIVMSLIANEDSNSEEIGQCALVITLPVVNNTDAPIFDNVVYQTLYDSTNTTLDTQLRIVNKEDLSKVNITILETEYQSNFDITYNKTNEFWSVTVLSLPESVNEDPTDLILTLVAKEDQNNSTGRSALVINFPILVAPTFSKNQYYGSYVKSTADLEVEYIAITNKEDLSEISLRFKDDDFSANFDLTFNDDTKNWNVTLLKPLTDDQINNKNELVLTLTANETGNSKLGIATVIIRLSGHSDNNGLLDFDNIYYTGSYQADGEKGVVTLDKNINLNTTEDVTKVKANITDAQYTEYFELRPNSDYYEVIVNKILPPTILSREVLVMSLIATLDDLTAFATLVIYLPIQANEKFVQFENGIYNGNYTIPKGGNDIFKFDAIRIVTNGDVANIQVAITEDSIYREYFNVTHDALDVNLTIGDLPAEVYKTIKVLPLKLSATLTNSTYIGYAIINIQIIYEESNDYGHIIFTSPIYNGRYEINEDTAIIAYDPINIDTDQDDSNIEVKAILGSDSFVDVTYANKQVYLTLQSTHADNIIRNLSNKAVVLQADLKSSSESTTTVVNFKVVDNDNGGADNSEMKFKQLIYRGECDFDKKNKRINFNVEEMTLDTDRMDSEINVTITNDNQFDQYFQVSYSQSEVHLLLGFLPEYIFKTKAYIILTLSAEVINITSIYAEAVVVIKLNYINGGISSDEKTSYIIAISILAAFIVLILAAAAAFYYFRLRHLKYKSMTDEEYKGVKFDKTAIQHSEAKKKTSSAVDQRRPTGFIFKKPTEQSTEETESTTDGAEGRERRKSVLFDDNVEKLQIETVVDDDIDKALEETENAD